MSTDKFDYVIVGGGSAGCVLANRLSEDPKVAVCLLEAGPPDRSVFIHIPIGVIRAMANPANSFRFFTAPQPQLKGREISVPRGRTLGGSSSINGMVYIRGHQRDYDEWSDLGNAGWGWNDVFPYFRKSEHNEDFGDDPIHGTGGPLNVKFLERPSPLHQTLFEAAESLQYKHIEDFNGANQEGFSIHQVTQKNGRRYSTARAFLDPARSRPNLRIMTNAPVSRIVVENGCAAGVEIRRDGTGTRIDASREVVLSAGAFVSPKLLKLSGIGNGEELQKLGITSIHHLPGVGENLQDHASVFVQYQTSNSTPYGLSLRALPKLAWEGVDYLLRRQGLVSSNLVEGGGFYKTDPSLDRPDIQYVFLPAHRDASKPRLSIGWGHGFSMTSVLLRPKSRGNVTLKSPDPGDSPVIDPRFFTQGDDLDILLRGLKESRRIFAAPAFEKFAPRELLPGTDIETDDGLRDYIRGGSATIFHPVGTCKMGPDGDGMAVVDHRLRVRGVGGLRVVDASIMPTIVGGNTNAPAIMIAEKAADMIKEDARA
jgi:choline dehydrogenase-like flavoprotein